MTGRRIGLGAVGLGIVVLVIATFASRRILLEEWYLSKLESTDQDTRKNAAEALAEYGSERSILPLMEASFDSLTSLVQEKGNPDALVSMEKNFAKMLDQRDRIARQISANSRDAGQERDLADRRKLQFLTNQQRSLDARAADIATEMARMLAIGPFFESLLAITEEAKTEVIPQLVRAIEDDNWHVRWQAAQLLGALGPDVKDSVPVLEVKSEEDPNAFVRYAAGEAIKSIEHKDEL